MVQQLLWILLAKECQPCLVAAPRLDSIESG